MADGWMGSRIDLLIHLGYCLARLRVARTSGGPSSLAIVSTAVERGSATASGCRRFSVALALFTALPAASLLSFVVLVDPHYLFGSPAWHGFNQVRPQYELHVVTAKPYQARRIRPDAVALGSSRVEVGIDSR